MSNIFMAFKLVVATMLARLNKLVGTKSQKGVTIIEYALLGALIAAALIGSIQGLQGDISTLFTKLVGVI